ncbi:MAG: hypothetical protein IVW53_15345 [Chloroflexi bacterium]|nr:hypothetical protein [Chloroflexota bacterium]
MNAQSVRAAEILRKRGRGRVRGSRDSHASYMRLCARWCEELRVMRNHVREVRRTLVKHPETALPFVDARIIELQVELTTLSQAVRRELAKRNG